MYPNAYPPVDLMKGPNGAQHPVRDRKAQLHAVTVLGEDVAARGVSGR
ncbi:hypothetical protein FHR93_002753 [Geodermatophilus sabuli]|uniref:Uncharacterized protein n=1 Tax=Geodermatophilus sabuli TaxID=1564158 RepID=A0A285EGT7_9ACTN|nr:hypothetical protein [Geodermatophilus sabuli]SNX97266.1 hypothetical protein SAMN06893097_106216 [Geodermatophilus sabuli]